MLKALRTVLEPVAGGCSGLEVDILARKGAQGRRSRWEEWARSQLEVVTGVVVDVAVVGDFPVAGERAWCKEI